MGFVFYQNVDDEKPGEEVTIFNANSSALKESQMQYNAVDCEVLGLKFATDANNYYLYAAPGSMCSQIAVLWRGFLTRT